jgi:GT2 family glycosyltransferase
VAEDFEIVLVDDASTDATSSVLARFRDAHPTRRITVVRSPRNLGVAGARNVGLRIASAEFVLFTDSDCTVEHGWLAAMLAALQTGGVNAVTGVVRDAAPRNLAERAYVGSARAIADNPRRSALIGGNMGFRRALLEQYGFDEALDYGCEDHDLAARLAADGHRIAFVPRAIIHHDHPLTLRSYLEIAYRQGLGSARFWYKHGIVGLDLLPLGAAVAVLPCAIIDARFLLASLFFLLAQLAGLAYIETRQKGKPLVEALQILPVCAAYSLVRGWSALRFFLRLAAGGEQAIRRARRDWIQRQRSRRP